MLSKGLSSLNKSEYYSAASYCFGASVNLRYRKLKDENLNERQIKSLIEETIDRVNEFRNFTASKELKTMTDLEAYMVVTDRLLESKERLTESQLYLSSNNTNSSLHDLAYGIERLNSAHTWAVFFGTPGRDYNINKKILDESCLKKISEVEERIQYIEFYLPAGTTEARQAVKKAYDDFYAGNPELCLYKSSIAKAKIDLILNNIAIDVEDLDAVIEDRSKIVRAVIAKQNSRGIFPILAYSYYEYANSLKASDKYSALLYLEYALELGNFDIYFEKKTLPFPKINKEYVLVFLTGLTTGAICGLVIAWGIRKGNKKK